MKGTTLAHATKRKEEAGTWMKNRVSVTIWKGREECADADRKSSDRKVDRDGYTTKKAQIEDLDVIVIGSEAGGIAGS